MQSGQNPHDPLTQLNSHMAYGAMAGLNPFTEMGLNPNDPNMLQTMMSSPQFLQQMSSVMSNPAVLDQIIASNPQLAAMGPQVREVFQSERFREMISNPERLQQMLQMASMFRDSGSPFAGNPFGALGGGGAGGFPAPGVPSTGNTNAAPTATPAANSQPGAAPAAAGNFPFFNVHSGVQAAANPFGATDLGAAPAPAAGGFPFLNANPFGAVDPAVMQQLFGMSAGGSGFGAAAVPPADTRSPEERFQVQLQQLQDMGFTNASQNVRALLATGGNVHSAIEYILGGGGL